ncbi:sigma-70 family RNA polymerase sigma factor [Streptomyces sp. NBC_00193]|uniref:sigma-70 family RNA polymerase sigma factor n=1 Tax=Streptomyces sp. NBC_00193 TaxID=2975675 RepID=UPI0022526C17|nr:sigma-70 family RNA polymerase sigma factor [Streptomyces sp. NBC_00193]
MGEFVTDAEYDPFGEQAVSSELAGVMPVEFVAFHSQNHVAYLEYAHLELGGEAAEVVVEDVFTFLLEVWPDALKEANLQAFAWAQLREHVERYRARQLVPVALVDTAKYAALRQGSRRRLELIESRSGVYEAIAELPDRHYDVVLLTYLLGLDTGQVAQRMGIAVGTVRSHLHTARRTLAKKIGIDLTPGEEKDL